jgi:4-hydroxy-2-oxoheptanedioate aldolase
VVKNLGIDMVFIETEHTPQNREMVSWMCQAYSALDLAPVVRIPAPDPYQAQMVLDGGAHGIIAPYIETVEQVRSVGGAVKFGPLKGRKLQQALDGELELEDEVVDYLGKRSQHKALFVNIESVPALEALDDILSEPYIDAVLVGPHDLSINLGIPEQYEHPEFERAINTIISKSRANGIGVGIHHPSVDYQIKWAKAGANLTMHSTDIYAFSKAMTSDLNTIRAALKDEAVVEMDSDSVTV